MNTLLKFVSDIIFRFLKNQSYATNLGVIHIVIINKVNLNSYNNIKKKHILSKIR